MAPLERLIRELEDDMVRNKTAIECGKMIPRIDCMIRLQRQVRDLAVMVRKLNGS